MTAENAAQKQQKQRRRGRPFQRGASGNPAGRPPGARNRGTLLLAAISDGDLHAIREKVVEMAKAGDLVAAKLIFDRVVPVPRARTVTLALPSMKSGSGREKARALTAVLEAVAAGEIEPGEAAIIADLVEKVGVASHNCCGLEDPPPVTKAQRARFKEQGGTWPALII